MHQEAFIIMYSVFGERSKYSIYYYKKNTFGFIENFKNIHIFKLIHYFFDNA